jgi:hypothetical protein
MCNAGKESDKCVMSSYHRREVEGQTRANTQDRGSVKSRLWFSPKRGEYARQPTQASPF